MKNPRVCKYSVYAILLFFFLCSSNVRAVKFYSINSLFGISSRVTNSICKDDNGFIWASSKTGILRLTDNNYRIYQLPYDTVGVLSVNLIHQNSRLIAYTNYGQVFEYNAVHDKFELQVNLSKMVGTDNFYLYSFLLDNQGNYWIALGSGIYQYQSGSLRQVHKWPVQGFYSMTWYNQKNIVIAKPESIWLLDIDTNELKCLSNSLNVSKFFVSSFFLDQKQQTLWMGTYSNGLFSYHFDTNKFVHVLETKVPKQPILAIESVSDSTLLIGIDGQGLWEVGKNGRQILNVYKDNPDVLYSLRGNGVYDIFCEEGKRVWVCTISGGISFYEIASPLVTQLVHQAHNANSLVDNDVNYILEDSDGKLWFATNNGVSCYNPSNGVWKTLYSNKFEHSQVFLTLCEDNEGRIWAGTYSSGVYLLDKNTGREIAHYFGDDREFSETTKFIFDIYKDSDGDIWIGGINGKFACYSLKTNSFRIYSNESIGAFTELMPNQLVLGCSAGLKILNKQTGEITTILADCVVQDICVIDDAIWVATSGSGLLEYNMKNRMSRKYTASDGLPSDFVNSIAYADQNLWLGTENGICRFHPETKAICTFSSVHPLSGLSYNKSALSQLKNGQLAYGTNNGAVLFAPETVMSYSSKGKLFVQDFTISGQSIRNLPSYKLTTPVDSIQSVVLNYSQNTISLELISMLMQSGSKFAWKLEGFDKEWGTPTDNRIITYTNIPSGKYKLMIKLFDSSLLKTIDERSIDITVIPPFWQKGWFWFLAIIVVSGVLILSFLYYINHLNQQHTIEKVRFFTNTAHDIRTSLTLLKAPVEELNKERNLSEKGRYYLNLAIDQARQLSTVVTQLIDFQKVDIGKEHLMLTMADMVKLIKNRTLLLESFASSKKVELVFMADCEAYKTAIDEIKIEKMVDNLISNAIKYSPSNSKIIIELKCEDRKWTLKVQDFGIGISKKAQRHLFSEFYRGDNAINSKVIGSGIGLLLVKKYVSMHGGNVRFESQENVGSTFQISIPFRTISGEKAITSQREKVDELVGQAIETPNPETADGEQKTQNRIKVLLVEDNDNLLNFMKNALSDEFEVAVASDGEIAWSYISKNIPDLVVSDIMMPNMDGFELCKLIKSTFKTSHIPVVLLTALSEKTDQLQGLGLGADDYLTKPFDMGILMQRIKSIIRNRKLVREKTLQLIGENTNENLMGNELNDKFVKKMMEVVQANISNPDFSKEQFASAMNVSSSLLYKKIKAFTDQSPTDFIKAIKLKHALELLQSRKYTVTEVSELCGFTSLAYFSKVFRNHFGKSPSEI